MTDPKPADVCLVLRPLPDSVPAAVRLRRLLKLLLRGFGFRCIRVAEVPAAARPANDEAGDGPA